MILLALALQDVDTLIRRLGDESYEVREAAGEEIARVGRAAVPALEKAVRSPDPELSARAAQLIRFLTTLHWTTDIDAALIAAKEGGKPILAYVSRPEPAHLLMVRTTFADPDVVDALNQKYILVWYDPWKGRAADEYTDDMLKGVAEGSGAVATYIAGSDGTLQHMQIGYWGPTRYLTALRPAPKQTLKSVLIMPKVKG